MKGKTQTRLGVTTGFEEGSLPAQIPHYEELHPEKIIQSLKIKLTSSLFCPFAY
jgi:hypothetical protein